MVHVLMIISTTTGHSMHGTGDGTTARNVSAITVVVAVVIMRIVVVADMVTTMIVAAGTGVDMVADMAEVMTAGSVCGHTI